MKRLKLASLLLLTVLPGCQWLEKCSNALDNLTTVKVDNPVMGPPPPRLAMTDDRVAESATIVRAENGPEESQGGLDVQPVDFQKGRLAREEELSDDSIVALVDGSPIFAADILEPYSKPIQEIEGKVPPAQLQEEKRKLIQRDLPGHVENRMLVLSLRKMLKKEQLEQLDKQLAEHIDEHIKSKGLNTPYEFDQQLRKQDGISFATWRTLTVNREMAKAYLREKAAKGEHEPTRAELLACYNAHLEKYSFPATVKWQLIEISFRKRGGKRQAYEVFEKVVGELKRKNGANFSDLAKELSDGPKAENGGKWDWTRQGSLADKQLDQAIFSVPVGSISDPIVGDDAFRLVKVNDRKPAGRVPFPEVQDEIKKSLKKSQSKLSQADILAELRSKTVVETIFDKEARKSNDETPFR